jgi:hypothetical protein
LEALLQSESERSGHHTQQTIAINIGSVYPHSLTAFAAIRDRIRAEGAPSPALHVDAQQLSVFVAFSRATKLMQSDRLVLGSNGRSKTALLPPPLLLSWNRTVRPVRLGVRSEGGVLPVLVMPWAMRSCWETAACSTWRNPLKLLAAFEFLGRAASGARVLSSLLRSAAVTLRPCAQGFVCGGSHFDEKIEW